MRRGVVTETLDCGDRIYVELREVGAIDSTVNLLRNFPSRSISRGDLLKIYQFEVLWTPKVGGFYDYPLERYTRHPRVAIRRLPPGPQFVGEEGG